MKYYGGCDVGSTYTKAVILDETGKIVGDLPLDKAAAVKWFFGLLFGIGAAVFLLQLIASL